MASEASADHIEVSSAKESDGVDDYFEMKHKLLEGFPDRT